MSRLIGLFTASYLARVIQPEGFGILGFATAFTSYFLIIVSFGIEPIAIREVSRDKNQLGKYVQNIFSIRLLLAAIAFAILFLVISFTAHDFLVKIVVLVIGVNFFSEAFSLNWVFQSIERMEFVSLRRISTSLLSLIAIFVFVRSKEDIIIAAVILTLSALLNSVLLINIAHKLITKIKFKFDVIFWKFIFKESYPLLISAFMISIYYNMDMIMLGYMKTQYDVGIYSAANKIFLVAVIPISLILSSVFPSLSKVKISLNRDFYILIRKFALMILPAGIICGSILYFFAELIIKLIFGDSFAAAGIPLAILGLNVVVVSVNVFLGNPLIAWGEQKKHSLAVTIGALTNIIFNLILIPKFSYNGAAFATLLSEGVVFLGVAFFNYQTIRAEISK